MMEASTAEMANLLGVNRVFLNHVLSLAKTLEGSDYRVIAKLDSGYAWILGQGIRVKGTIRDPRRGLIDSWVLVIEGGALLDAVPENMVAHVLNFVVKHGLTALRLTYLVYLELEDKRVEGFPLGSATEQDLVERGFAARLPGGPLKITSAGIGHILEVLDFCFPAGRMTEIINLDEAIERLRLARRRETIAKILGVPVHLVRTETAKADLLRQADRLAALVDNIRSVAAELPDDQPV
jgi:hypothetical protein